MTLNRRVHGVFVVVLFGLLAAVFFYPVAFGGKTLLTSSLVPGTLPSGPFGTDVPHVLKSLEYRVPIIDPPASAWTIEPWTAIMSRMVRSGEIPLWNPYMGFGVPFAANAHSGAFFPPRALLFAWPSAVIWDLYLLLRLVVIGCFMYWFLRLLRVCRAHAVVGAVTLMFTGHFVLYVNMWHLDVEMLLPALMVAAETLRRARTARAIGIFAVLLAASILAGSPESLFCVWLFVLVYYAFRTVDVAVRSRRVTAALWAYARPVALAAGLAFVIASPLLALAVEYVWYGHSPNHHPLSTVGLWGYPASGAVSLIVPYFFDQLTWVTSTPPGVDLFTITPYLGVAPLVLAALAPRRRITIFFGVYAAVSILKAYSLPGLNVLGAVPGFNVIIFPKYNQPVVAFCVATLAALSLDRLARAAVGPRFVLRAWLTAAAIFGVIVAFTAYHVDWIARTGVEAFMARLAIPVAALAGATILATVAALRRSRFRRTAAVGLTALVIVELFLYVPKHMPARVDPFTAPPFIQFLLRDPDAFRVYGLDDVLFPDTSGVYGLADVRAIDAMYPRRYLPLIRQTLDPAPSDHFTTGARADIFRNQAVVDAMNVKYVLSIAPLDSLDFWGPAKSDPSISVEPYAIDGAMKPVLVQRPPSRVTFPVRVPDGGATLAFSVGSTPSARPDPNDDGIRYRLESVTRTGDVKPLFAKHIERRARPGNGQWHPETIDLGAYAGQRIGLTFVAEAGHAASAERGAWADLRLIGPDQDDAWRLVYDAEVKIYRNDRTLPRAFVVHAADVVASADEALARVTAPGFDPRRVVVLEERVSPALVDSARAHVAEAVQIRSYGAHRIELRARLDTPGMLVLGDTHYPGWRATVDGKPARIHRANFLFRAVALEAGDHRVEFAYRPRHFYAALLCAGLALTGVAIVIVRGPRRSRRETAA